MSPTPIAQATSLAAAIRAKVPMMALLGGPKQAARVEIAIRELAGVHIGFIRISNPLAAPLSLERLVLQITRHKADEVRRDKAERVLRALIAQSGTRRQVVVVVEQAETLTPKALEFLHGLPGLSHPSLVPVQVALVGTPELGARLADNRTYIIRDPADPAPATAGQTPIPAAQAPRPSASRKGRPRFEVPLLAGLGLCAVVAILFMIHGPFQPGTIPHSPTPPSTLTPTETQAPSSPTASEPQQTAAAAPQDLPVAPSIQPAGQQPTETPPALAQASPQASPAELPAPEPPASPSTPPLEDAATARARLYREFTAFLNTRSLGRRLLQAEREALFQDYLARHQAAPPSPQTAAPAEVETSRIPGEPRVLLFFASGSDLDRMAAEHQAELLRNRVAGLELQPAPAVPAIPTIRYEFLADRTAAFALAQTTLAQGGEWQVEDMTASPKRPEPGMIEMWLPRL